MYQELKSPISVQSEITSRCVNNCLYCYNYWRNNKPCSGIEKELTIGEWLKIAKKLVKAEILKMTLTGGEPLLRKDLIYPLAKYLTSKGVEVKLNSNLCLLEEDDCRKIKDTGISSILTSFPSYIESTYNLITNSRNYKNVLKGIELILKYEIPLSVNMVVTHINKHEIFKTGEYLHSIGIKSFAATPIVPCYFKDVSLELKNEEIINALDDLLKLELQYQMNVDIVEAIPRCIASETSRYEFFFCRDCGAGRTTLAISSNGEARPCTHSSLVYGNLLKQDIYSIWNKMAIWRKNTFIPEFCINCKELELCSLGCRVAAYTKFGEYNQLDPRANISYLTNPRTISSRISPINTDSNFIVNKGLKYRKEIQGYVVFSPQNGNVILINEIFLNFLGYLSKLPLFSVKSLELSFKDKNLYQIINFLNMKGMIKKTTTDL